jgi:nucleoside phosphorylase
MILIHTALLCEAQSVIEHYKLKKTNSSPKIYSNDTIIVLIGGIGKENTYRSLEYIFSHFTISKAINLGIAGCSDTKIEIGTLFCTNQQLEDIQYHKLSTVDTPQTTPTKGQNLFDMEGNHFITLVSQYVDTKNIYLFKVVSDHLNISKIDKENVKQLILKNVKKIKKYIQK